MSTPTELAAAPTISGRRSDRTWTAIRWALRWAKDNPDMWAQSYAAAVGLEPEVAAASQGHSLRLPISLSDEYVASEQGLADLFAESKQIADAPEFANWVDRRYNGALNPLLINR